MSNLIVLTCLSCGAHLNDGTRFCDKDCFDAYRVDELMQDAAAPLPTAIGTYWKRDEAMSAAERWTSRYGKPYAVTWGHLDCSPCPLSRCGLPHAWIVSEDT